MINIILLEQQMELSTLGNLKMGFMRLTRQTVTTA